MGFNPKPVIDPGKLHEMDLTLLNDIAANNYENSLSQNNYSDVLFDVFADQSKIASSSSVNITAGTNGNVKLPSGTTASRGSDDNTANLNSKRGVQINPNTNLNGVQGKISSQTSGATKAYLYDASDSLLDSTDISSLSSGDVFVLNASLTSGNNYQVLTNAEGSDYVMGYNGSPTFPYTSGDVDITAGYLGLGNSDNGSAFTISEITSAGATNGSITSVNKSLSFVPTKVIIQQDGYISGDGDITYELYNSSGTLIVTVDQSTVGTEVNISVSDKTFYIVSKIDNPDGFSTPTINEYAVMFV